MGLKPRILLVEDNLADQKLALRGLRAAAGSDVPVDVVNDGEEAIEYLRAGRIPGLVILDLNLPKRDGREVLAYIKGHDTLRNIPVVVLTTSEAREDIEIAYRLGANSYFTKSLEIENFFQLMEQLTRYWFSWAKLPTSPYTFN